MAYYYGIPAKIELSCDSLECGGKCSFKNWNPSLDCGPKQWDYRGEHKSDDLTIVRLHFQATRGSNHIRFLLCLPWVNHTLFRSHNFVSCWVKLAFSETQKITRFINVPPGIRKFNTAELEDGDDDDEDPKHEAILLYERFCSVEELQNCIKRELRRGVLHEYIDIHLDLTLKWKVALENHPEDFGVKRLGKYGKCVSNLRPSSPHSDVVLKGIAAADEGKDTEHQVTKFALRVHKCVLAAVSPMFKDLLAKNNNDDGSSEEIIIDAEGVNKDTMKYFLKFLYRIAGNVRWMESCEPIEDVDFALGVLKLSEKYDVNDLKQFCTMSIVACSNNRFGIENALETYNCGWLYEIMDLRFRSCQWIQKNKDELFTKEGNKILQNFIKSDAAKNVQFIQDTLLMMAN